MEPGGRNRHKSSRAKELNAYAIFIILGHAPNQYTKPKKPALVLEVLKTRDRFSAAVYKMER